VNNYVTEGVAEYVLTLCNDDFDQVCIDVGAFHAEWLSNSYLLELLGWKVFCIEPNPHCMDGLSSRAHVYQYAMGPENKDDVDFYIFTDPSGALGEAGGTGLINHPSMQNMLTDHIKVKMRTLDWFIENCAKVDHVDFLSIDVELSEMGVLNGIDLDKWGVKVICIENIYSKEDQHTYLDQHGFKKINRLVFNDIYIRK